MKYFLLIILFFYTIISNGQTTSFGLATSPEITTPVQKRGEVKTVISKSFGLAIMKQFSKKQIWFNTGVGITQRGYRVTEKEYYSQYGNIETKWTYSATDLDIPLILLFKIRSDKKLFGIMSLGTILGFKIREGVQSQSILSNQYFTNDKDFGFPDRVNLRLSLGLGYKLSKKYQIVVDPFIMKDAIALRRGAWKYGYFSLTHSAGIRVMLLLGKTSIESTGISQNVKVKSI